jgi:hypothetical protein
MEVYQGLLYGIKTYDLRPHIEALKGRKRDLQDLLPRKDISSLRAAIEHYQVLLSHKGNPLKTFEQLAVLLNKNQYWLESLTWKHNIDEELTFSFLILSESKKDLSLNFESFLLSCKEIFPKSLVKVLEAPLNSGPHEVYKSPSNTSLPLVNVKMVLP